MDTTIARQSLATNLASPSGALLRKPTNPLMKSIRPHQAARLEGKQICASVSSSVNAVAVAERPSTSSPTTIDTTKTPKQLGFTMPGEFEPHVGCWMGWPESDDSKYLWREGGEPARQAYANVAKAISQFEPLFMIANPGEAAANARRVFADSPNVTVVEMPINDGWTRDWGPSCIARDADGRREVAGVHWDYDCYGAPGKIAAGRPAMMPNWDKDFEAGRALLTSNGLPVFEAPLHLEGGSIHSDGQGTMVVTEECLLDPSRNPHLDKAGIENVLKEYLGLEKIIWLWRGMEGDTEVVNGHVDNMCCFIRPGVVALAWSDNEDDPQHEVGVRNLEILNNTTDARGRKLEVVKVHCPPPLFRTYKEAAGVDPEHIAKGYCPRLPGVRMPATYINHYAANGGVVVPQFGGIAAETDRLAIETLQQAYGPDYKVVGVKSREVLLNAGNIHCITQQWVAGW
ncbi:g286 [Coccomyxa elongata]